MKLFEIILDADRNVIKAHVAADNRKKALAECTGNGEVVRIKDVTQDFPLSREYFEKALMAARYGDCEQKLLLAMFDKCAELLQ